MLKQGLDKVCAMTNRAKKKRIGQSGLSATKNTLYLFERIGKKPGICA